MPAGKEARMEIDMARYTEKLAFFGTRGMPAHKYPSLLNMIAAGWWISRP
jgi:hypothetical protein